MGMMDVMVKMIKKEKREDMMINMMPLMMEGIDMNALMPRMMGNMLADITVDDVVNFLKNALKDKEKIQELLVKLQEASLMQKMMFKTYKSNLGFEETVQTLEKNGEANGWDVEGVRDLQKTYIKAGLKDMSKVKILYFCNPEGGYAILKNDDNKPMSVMMPMPVSVYEKTDGTVEIAAMNLGMMGDMFSGVVKEVLINGAHYFENSLEGIAL